MLAVVIRCRRLARSGSTEYSHDDKQDPGAEVLIVLASLYAKRQLTPRTIRAYQTVLHDTERDLLMMAVPHVGSRSKF